MACATMRALVSWSRSRPGAAPDRMRRVAVLGREAGGVDPG
ncbi:MAG: hypothetical protein AVDCRST_MAG49-2683 [uncultured Thermomicrobiales bacterium]|uniref:Uncharacterized protein n=1 Tax=uncultured Thermomicrobiales bacterium TaxID=1645740 RepID=A0A6J4V237_9BACT|nr:MAG: hypothetical protein AVDCRST_MAG49-2683 [uncultured Thermomicrobiales bacterium]